MKKKQPIAEDVCLYLANRLKEERPECDFKVSIEVLVYKRRQDKIAEPCDTEKREVV